MAEFGWLYDMREHPIFFVNVKPSSGFDEDRVDRNLNFLCIVQQYIDLYEEIQYNMKNAAIYSSEIRGLCLMTYSSETLQNFP